MVDGPATVALGYYVDIVILEARKIYLASARAFWDKHWIKAIEEVIHGKRR